MGQDAAVTDNLLKVSTAYHRRAQEVTYKDKNWSKILDFTRGAKTQQPVTTGRKGSTRTTMDVEGIRNYNP